MKWSRNLVFGASAFVGADADSTETQVAEVMQARESRWVYEPSMPDQRVSGTTAAEPSELSAQEDDRRARTSGRLRTRERADGSPAPVLGNGKLRIASIATPH